MINDWREKSKSRTASIKVNEQLQRKSTKFYKLTRPSLVQKSAPKKKTISELPTIVLCSKENKLTCLKSSTGIQTTATICMKYDNKKSDPVRSGQPKKKLKTCGKALDTSSVIDEECLEDDFIKGYLNCEKQWKPVQRKCSLLDSLDLVK